MSTTPSLRRRPNPSSEAAFVDAAGKDSQASTASNAPASIAREEQIDWGHPKIRWDFSLRMSEAYKGKLDLILRESSEKSMHALLIQAIDDLIDKRLPPLLDAGHRPVKS